MKKWLFFILNGFVLIITFFIYYFSMIGFWVEPTYKEAKWGIAIFTAYLILLFVQVYFIFIKKKSERNRFSFYIVSGSILILFLLGQIEPLKDIYRNDNSVYKDPLFEEYAKQVDIDGIKFDLEESNWDTEDYDYYFNFQVKNKNQVTQELVKKLNEQVPMKMERPYVLSFNKGDDEILSMFYSNEKQFAGCLSESDPRNCDRIFDYPLPPVIRTIQQYLADRNIGDRYIGEDENAEPLEPIYLFHIEDTIGSYQNSSGKVKLYFEKLKGEVTEADVVSLLGIFRENMKEENVIAYFSDSGKDPVTDASVSFSPVYENYSDFANKLEYNSCNKEFCKNILAVIPDDPKNQYIYSTDTDE